MAFYAHELSPLTDIIAMCLALNSHRQFKASGKMTSEKDQFFRRKQNRVLKKGFCSVPAQVINALQKYVSGYLNE